MKIAIPYDRGKIFDHFGHAPYFEIITIEDSKVRGGYGIIARSLGNTNISDDSNTGVLIGRGLNVTVSNISIDNIHNSKDKYYKRKKD